MLCKKTALSILVALVLGLAPFGFGQLTPRAHSSHNPHTYYNPETGQYEPVRPMVESDATPAATTPTTGTLTFTYTITVKSKMPKNAVISCEGSATVSEATGYFADEGGSGIATGSGTSYTCTVVINYSWLLLSPTKDVMELGGSVTMEYGYEATATNGTGTIVVPAIARSNEQEIAPMAVPKTGTSTPISVEVTL